MPLRDHFHPPLSKSHRWGGFHATWPTAIVSALNRVLPKRYIASPRVNLGTVCEIDVAATENSSWNEAAHSRSNGGVATAVWTPPRPTLDFSTDVLGQDEYEVLIYDEDLDQRLVAAIEIVSPSNKDRPESRSIFVSKCLGLLQQEVSVAIIDLVTSRRSNLYGELLELAGRVDASSGEPTPPCMQPNADGCRGERKGECKRGFHPCRLVTPYRNCRSGFLMAWRFRSRSNQPINKRAKFFASPRGRQANNAEEPELTEDRPLDPP
jgi:hypothetical protein